MKDYESNPFKVIFIGLQNFFKHNQNAAIVIMILGSFGGVFNVFSRRSSETSNITVSHSTDWTTTQTVAWILLPLLLILFAIILGIYFYGIVGYYTWKTSRLEHTTFKEALAVVNDKFWIIVTTGILVFLRVIGGLFLLIIPGIRAALRYDMVLMPIFEGATPKEAIAKMKILTKGRLIEIFGMSTASAIIPFLGTLLHFCGQSIMYPQLVALDKVKGDKPPIHWLNYFAVVILLFVFLAAALVSVALAIAWHK